MAAGFFTGNTERNPQLGIAQGRWQTPSNGLGPAHTVSLADAREKAQECRKLRLEGQDPIEVRRAERSAAQLDAARAITFKSCAEFLHHLAQG